MGTSRVLIIGVGSIGERHLRCFRATGRVEVGFCEPNEALRRTIARRYEIPQSWASLDDVFSDGSFRADIAVIAVPAPLHVPVATRLVEEGIHVFIEKPLSISLEGIDGLQAAIERRGVKAAVAYTYRSHPAMRDMKAAIDSGRFGRPVQAVSVWGQHFPKYRPAYREIYYTSRATGGGIIQDLLPHALNASEYLVGPIDRVQADAGHLALEGVEIEDTVHVLARHGSVMACYSANQHQAPNENTITVICERGTARFDLNQARWQSMFEPEGGWTTEYQFSQERDDIFISQAHLFLDVVAGKAEPACTVAEGLQTLQATLAVLEAADHPGWREVHRTT